MTESPLFISRLRRDRNLAGIAAVLFIIFSAALSLPSALKRRVELKRTNYELAVLQGEIVAYNNKIVETQEAIRRVQQEIEQLLKPAS